MSYNPNPTHRNNTPSKTQWNKSISENKEKEIFEIGFNNNWKSDGDYFSLLFSNKKLVYLDSDKKLNYARFTGSPVWHGWPANGKKIHKRYSKL